MNERLLNNEEMFTAANERSLCRGRRIAPRTEVCRPAVAWGKATPDKKVEGVMLDLNPYGMKLRMLHSFPPGTELMVQMMRDEGFTIPLSPPIEVRVVRTAKAMAGLTDHGIKVTLSKIRRSEEGRPTPLTRAQALRRRPTRMHTVDYTVGNRDPRRMGK